MGKWRKTKQNCQIDSAAKWYTFTGVLFILRQWLIGVFLKTFFWGQCWVFVAVNGLQALGLSDCGARA